MFLGRMYIMSGRMLHLWDECYYFLDDCISETPAADGGPERNAGFEALFDAPQQEEMDTNLHPDAAWCKSVC